jgi:DNA-binding NarL/FixJ family response regulator
MAVATDIGRGIAPADETDLVYGAAAGDGYRPVNPRSFFAVPGGLVDRPASATAGGRAESYRESAEGPGILREVRALIVDDSALHREYLATVLASHGAPSPALAWDMSSMLAALEQALPRVILVNMTTRDSAMLLRQALKFSPHARVVVMGVSEDDEPEIVACAELGVAGYHVRTESLDDLIVSIHKVAVGESSCSPRISAILLRRLSALASQRQSAPKELVLTDREAQILRMLEMGRSNMEIAADLCIAVHTVKNHVHSLLTKLGVSTRAQAAALSRTMRYAEDSASN